METGQNRQRRQQEKNKELQQPEGMPSGSKKLGRRCRSLCEQRRAIVRADDSGNESIAVDSEESSDESTKFWKKSQKSIRPESGEPISGDGGTYSGRLRTRTPTLKKRNWDFFTHRELGFSDDESEDCGKDVIEQFPNVEALPTWARKKQRTHHRSSRALRRVRGSPKSNQATRKRNLRDYRCACAKSSQDGLTSPSRYQLRNKQVPFDSNDRRSAPVRALEELKHDSCRGNEHLGRPLQEDNAVAVCRNASSGTPLSSLGRIGSSRKRSKLVRSRKMVTNIESFRTELGGHHEGPVTSMKPAMRKRRAEIAPEDLPDYHGINALSNGRAWSDGTERAVQQQFYQLTSDGEEVTENPGCVVTRLFDQSPPLPGNLPLSDLEQAQFEKFLNGETGRGDPQFDTLDAFVNGEAWPPLSRSQSYLCGESNLAVPNENLGVYIEPDLHNFAHGVADVFPMPDMDAFSIASEPSTNDSVGTVQSDDDYHPPACHSGFDSKTDNVGTPILTGYPSRSRRSLSFRNDSVSRRVESVFTLQSDVDPAPLPPSKEAQPASNTSGVVDGSPIPENQYGPLSTTIASSTNDASTAILDVSEDVEPDDDNEFDEEDEDGEQRFFNLNEPPAQQPRKNSKARKKHRPKVFREGRPYRRRKSKEDISKTKETEGNTVVEKPRARKKRVTADLKSTQGDLHEKQGTQGKPVTATCGPAASGCAQCQENQLTSHAERGLHLQDRRIAGAEESSQTPVPVLRRGPKNSLILGEAFGECGSLHAQDSSPFSSPASGSRSGSRKRAEEDNDSLNGATNPAIRRVRRELFKRARGKGSTAIVEENLEFRENCQDSLNEVTVHPSPDSAANTVETVVWARTDASHSRELVSLSSNEGSTQETLVDPCIVAAEVVGAIMPRRWSPASFEEGISGVTQNFLTGGVLKDGPTTTGKGTPLPRKIGRAAARAKAGQPNLLNRGKTPPIRRPPSITTMVKQVVNMMANLQLNESDRGLQLVPHVSQQTALVPYDGPFNPLRKKKLRAKVMLEEEDKRVWKLLMTQGTCFEDGNSQKDAPRDWEEERATMKTRAEKFINRMHLVQGDRRFSVWKGSVVDSVVGAFLTQNVSDHLSSSAFMCLAARFPVPRKKNFTADTSQETTITEVRVEATSQKTSGLPVSSDDAEAVPKGGITDFPVEEAFDNSEKSSVTGEGSSMFGDQQAYDSLSTKVTDCKLGRELTTESLERREESTSQDHAGTESHAVQRANSSCSSKPSQGQCCSQVHNSTSQVGDSLEVRGSEQQKTCGVIKDFTALHSRPGDVFCLSSGHYHMNSISPTAPVTGGDREVTQMALPAADSWIQTDSHLLEGSLIVDLSPTADDLVMDTVVLGKSIPNGLFSHAHIPPTFEVGGNSVPRDKIRCSDPPGLEMSGVSAEEVEVSSGSVVSSSHSFDGHKLSHISVIPGSEVNCFVGEERRANAGGVIFPSPSFDNNKSYDKQLVVSSTAVRSEETNKQLQGGLSYRTKLSYLTELSNLHTLKGLMRNKIQFLKKARTKRGQNSRAVNWGNNSDIVNSTSVDQLKESEDKKKRPVISLTGIARAKLEESNITSKVAVDWEAVRLKYTGPTMSEDQQRSAHFGCKSFGSSKVENGVDWDAVRSAKLEDIADVIKERGMNNVLAGRIKAFLERVQKEHGSVDLEWLRTVSVEEAKSFLLSVRGLGLKSVECIRLLTLHHLAFPVDTNVGRICVRLGWVPLEPLPEELQLHLLELYPVQETIQKYLWPRLCSLDQRTLYELHYQMITFGKVFCTKSRPNCNACPMRDDCQHFASALASARLALPAAAHEDVHSTNSEPLALPAATAAEFIKKAKLALPPLEQDAVVGEEGESLSKINSFILSQRSCEPIVEEPRTPEPVVADVTDIEDYDTYVGVSSQPDGSDKGSSSEVEITLPPAEVSIHDTSSKALVLLPPGLASIPVPKLKNVGRLRTVHYVYELPDNHPLVQQMDPREVDDPCVYLLAIWSPGESPQAPPVLDDLQTNGTCDGFNDSEEETVKGTLLVPCRTAMRGIFPLNGTYFQVNEVFADHASSVQPIEVPRTLLWNLRRRFVYFGTSVTTIFKGLSTEEIQACFWRGYVCVRGFDNETRCPRPLAARLHFPASKMVRKQKEQKTGDSNAWAED